MLIESRLAAIIDLVEREGSMTVAELTARLQSSESTIRRDLTELHKRGKVIKVHGGATAVDTASLSARDVELKTKYHMHKEEKEQIAEYAASLIRPDDYVFMDAGSTTELIVDYITEKQAVFVTNGIEQARKLLYKGCRVYLTGGELKPVTEAIVGELTVEMLERYNFTKGFWGTNGITIERGFSTPEVSESMVKRKAIQQCAQPYIVSDPSKFGQVSPITFAGFYDVKVITTKVAVPGFEDCENIIEISRF